MPQIVMIVSPEARDWDQTLFDPRTLDSVSDALILVVERIFGLEGENDVAFDAYFPVYTKNEPSIQIEVRYTAGEDEYHTGKIFEPDKNLKEKLSEEIIKTLNKFFPNAPQKVSAWIIPLKESFFRIG